MQLLTSSILYNDDHKNISLKGIKGYVITSSQNRSYKQYIKMFLFDATKNRVARQTNKKTCFLGPCYKF